LFQNNASHPSARPVESIFTGVFVNGLVRIIQEM
jgi:hypothetical protein